MGLQRQFYRAQAKVMYKKFKENWNAKAADSPDGRIHDEKGNAYNRPTFNQWLKMNENLRRLAKKERLETSAKKEPELEEKDLSWE